MDDAETEASIHRGYIKFSNEQPKQPLRVAPAYSSSHASKPIAELIVSYKCPDKLG